MDDQQRRGLFGGNVNAGSNMYGNNQQNPSSPSSSQQSFFAGRDRENIPQSDLAESQTLQSRYLESFTPGNKKKSNVVSVA